VYEISIHSDDITSEVDDEGTNCKKNCDSHENVNESQKNETILKGEELLRRGVQNCTYLVYIFVNIYFRHIYKLYAASNFFATFTNDMQLQTHRI